MKSQLICLCAFTLVIMVVPAYTQVTDLSKTNYGIWQTFGDPVSSSINPEIRGRLCNFRWADLEPTQGQWQWKQFDSSLAVRAEDGLPVIFMVYTEEDAPQWVYSNGVPRVAQKDKKGSLISYTPFYADAKYKLYFRNMITKVREHVETLPTAVRNQVIAVQACLGSTGDYISYKGDVDPQYRISSSGFYSLFQEFSQAFYDEYKNTTPKISVLSNPKNNGPDQAAWLFQNCPGGWIKTGSLGKGFQLNDEVSKAGWLYPMINSPILNGEYVRTRSELIGGTTSTGWWNKAPAKNMFALMCYDIYWGLDWNNQGYDQINDKIYDSAYGFYNKYAGEKDPAKSVYAMCALRDGLDASDAVRFPAGLYGTVQRGNAGRYVNIANEYTANGAKLEDVPNAMSDENNNLGAKGTNDVGWDVFPGNYERYLHQIKANQTSVGYWNIESANKNDMYGKFGRGFDLAKGKDALYFDVEDAFLNNTPLNSKQPIVIEIIYFDNSYGSWQLFYDGGSNKDKPSISVKGTNSKLWKRASVTINDAYLGNGAENNADFYIKNTGTENVIFSTVELRRPYKGEVMGLTASNLTPFSTVCANATSYQTLFVIGSFLPGGNTVVGPLKGFGFSIDSGKTYPDSVIIKDHGAVFSKKIFIKFKPDNEGIYNGDIPVRGDNVAPITIPVAASSLKSSPSLVPVIKPVNCFGSKDASIDLVCNGGTGPFTYSWSGTSNFKAVTEDINGIGAGSYTVTVNSLGGCVTKTTIDVSGPPALNINVLAPQMPIDQSTANITVSASGGTAPYTGTGNFTTGPGTYTYVVTDANGCSSSANITITQSQSTLAAFANAQNINCHGGFTTVNISGAGGKAPYSGTGTFMVSAGTYTYTITDADGTVSSATVIVNEPPLLTANAAAGKISCYGGNTDVAVSATGGVAPYTGTGNFTVGAGIYTYSVKDANGCPTVKTINLTEPAALEVTAIAEPIAEGKTTTIVSVTAAGGIAPYTGIGNFTASEGTNCYTVADANGCKIDTIVVVTSQLAPLSASATQGNILCNGGTTTVTISAIGGQAPYTGTGNYTVGAGTYTYTVSDALGKICNATVTVTEPAVLMINSITKADVSACKTGSGNILINTTGGTMPYAYTLNTGSYQLNNQFGNLADGSYTVIVKDNNGCITSAPAVITKSAPMKAWYSQIDDVSSCGLADGSVTVINEGGLAPYEYSINNEDFQTANTFTNLPESDYTVTIRDSRGCETSALTTIARDSELKLSVNSNLPVSGCSTDDGEIRVTASGGGGGYQYCINGQPFNGTNIFSGLTIGDYTITVKDWRGCSKSVTASITKMPALVAKIQSVTNEGACGNGDGALQAGLSGGSGPYLYSINGGLLQPQNTFNNLSSGIYTLQVKDGRGCIASAIATIGRTQQMLMSADTTAISCKGGSNGTITVTNSGGIAPFQYSIDGKSFGTKNIFGNLKAGVHSVAIKDSRNCTALFDVTMVNGTSDCGLDLTGVHNPRLDSLIKVAVLPNPSPTEFTLIFSSANTEKVEIMVIDMAGRIVYRASGNTNEQYHFGNGFAAGMYAVRIMQGPKTQTIKVIKTRGQ
ncbi:MAG: T9SS type A sorting domain-containing protein [Panacibacter sp.]